MNTSAVIQLSCQAAESVLRFRAVGFTRRPVIDLQSFRAAVTAQIEKAAKDHQHRFEVPLAEVVNYAGIGAARAARQWNGISHKENHVAIEWFRNCVCNLVSGVVSDIGQMAFEDQGMNASMYLELDDYDPFDVPSYSKAGPVRRSSHYIPVRADDRGRSQNAETEQDDAVSPASSTSLATSQASSSVSEPGLLHHEINRGYAALDKLAECQKDTSARADFIKTTKRLRTASEPPCDGNSQKTLVQRPAKRARQASPTPRTSSSQACAASINSSKAPRNVSWTKDEVNLLVRARDRGQGWNEIGNMLPRHTNAACQAKYRYMKNKEVDKKANSMLRIPSADDSSQSEEDQGLRDGDEAEPSQNDQDKPAAADPGRINGFNPVNKDVADQGTQNGGENSMANANSYHSGA